MATHKTAYVVTTNSNTAFLVRYNEQFENIHVDTWHVWPDVQPHVLRQEFANLNGLLAALRELGTPRDILLPVYISVLTMIGFDVYLIDEKEQS